MTVLDIVGTFERWNVRGAEAFIDPQAAAVFLAEGFGVDDGARHRWHV